MLLACAGSIWLITACAECLQIQRPATRATVPVPLSDAHAQETPKEVVYAEVLVERTWGRGAAGRRIGGNGRLGRHGDSGAGSEARAAQNRCGSHRVRYQLHLAQP